MPQSGGIQLSNDRCAARITADGGARVTSFKAHRFAPGRDGRRLPDDAAPVEWVGPHGLQTWLKHGADHDPASGVLHLLYYDFHARPFDIKERSSAAHLSREAHGIR